MGIARLIRRAGPLIVIGVAGAAAARRRSERMRQAELGPPPYPPPVAEPEPALETDPEPEPEPEPEPGPSEQPTVADTALEQAPWLEVEPEPHAEGSEAASVTEIVDDLLVPDAADESIQDATVVEGFADEVEPPDDEALAEAARAALSDEAGVLPGGVTIEVEAGYLVLKGQVERAEAIAEIERRAAEVPGIRSVSSLLHLPGTPPPAPSEHR